MQPCVRVGVERVEAPDIGRAGNIHRLQLWAQCVDALDGRLQGSDVAEIAARCAGESATTPSTYAFAADTTSDLGLALLWDSVVIWLTDQVATPVRVATPTTRPVRRLGLIWMLFGRVAEVLTEGSFVGVAS